MRRAVPIALLAVSLSASAQDATSPTEWSIAELQAAFEAGTLSSVRLVELSLARIEAYDASGPRLNAILALNPKALDRARELDDERARTGPRSRLHGIPVLLKDNLDTADLATTAAARRCSRVRSRRTTRSWYAGCGRRARSSSPRPT